MKNKLLLSILAAFGLAGASSQAQTTTFVDVSSLGAGIVDDFVDENGVKFATANGSEASVIKVDQRWTRDKVYLITQNTTIDTGVTLVIEPGTLVRFEPHVRTGAANNNPADPGALVVARGGKLIAAGTADAPIIFTSLDDPNVPGGQWTIPPVKNRKEQGSTAYPSAYQVLREGYTVVKGSTNLTGEYTLSNTGTFSGVTSYTNAVASGPGMWANSGMWGGVVFLGQANIAGPGSSTANSRSATAATGAGLYPAEGMAAFGFYAVGGGDNDADDQGVIRFLSNRYGGYRINLDSELNAFSCYGVGYNTVMEFLEDWCNKDDSFEFWGGCNTVKYVVSMFCGDDGLDTDAGWVGNAQFVLQVQNSRDGATGTATTGRGEGDSGDNLSENDGPEGSLARPLTVATVANATFVGRGYGDSKKTALCGPEAKASASIKFYNNVITDAPAGGLALTGTKDLYTNTAISALGYDDSGYNVNGQADTSNGRPFGEVKGNIWWRCGLAYDNSKTPSLTNTLATVEANSKIATASQLGFADNGRSGASSPGSSAAVALFGSNLNSLSTSSYTVLANSNIVNLDPGFTIPLASRIVQDSLSFIPSEALVKDGGYNIDESRAPQLADLTPAPHVGAVRNNPWYAGWTMLSQSGILKSSDLTPIAPVVSVEASGADTLVKFGTQNGVKYSVEVSTDNKKFSQFATVEGTGSQASVSTGSAVSSTAKFYRVVAF